MNLKFVAQETFRTIRLNRLNFFLASLVLAICLFLFLIFFTLTLNIFSLVRETSNRIEIYAFLEEKVSYREIADKVFLIAGVKEVRYVPKDEALKELEEDLGEDVGILSALDKNPLPNSLRIRLEPNLRSSLALLTVEKKLTNIPGIKEVWSGRKILERLEKTLRIALLAALGILFAVGVAVIFITFQSIEAIFFQRAKEIEIMRLVGASEYLVSAPFYLQGFLQGLGGGLFAFLGVALLNYFVSRTLIIFSFPTLSILLLSLSLGAILGILGSFTALSRMKFERK